MRRAACGVSSRGCIAVAASARNSIGSGVAALHARRVARSACAAYSKTARIERAVSLLRQRVRVTCRRA
ncbi:hypothetical protein WJ02_09000 [Burkholderia vietnamiensis]|nr:hypothetical protein WJ02_09000 [Burkholderia vietnamiensis]